MKVVCRIALHRTKFERNERSIDYNLYPAGVARHDVRLPFNLGKAQA